MGAEQNTDCEGDVGESGWKVNMLNTKRKFANNKKMCYVKKAKQRGEYNPKGF